MTQADSKQPGLPTIDVLEYGGKREGVRQAMDRRLFMQLLVVDTAPGQSAEETGKRLADVCARERLAAVVYADAMGPHGIGLLTWSEDPAHFVRKVRPIFAHGVSPRERWEVPFEIGL